MDSNNEQYNELLKALLPEEIFTYFELIKVEVQEQAINVYLDELNLAPEGYRNIKLISKGFYPSITVQDFPIRERAVYLHVRRRKWQVESTGEIISNTWDTTAKGTRYTKGFASFLKEVFGQLPGQQPKS